MSNRKPNVVFVITDDQGYGDLSCTGNPIISTPNIDKLYEESTKFKEIPVRRASLKICHHEVSKQVTEEDKYITFELELKAGPAHLQTYLEDEEGNVRGAYYVYVNKLR